MVKLNHHYQKLSKSFLFTEIEKRIISLKEKNPSISFLNLGVGDFTLPLFPSVIKALEKAVQEMGSLEQFRGYGPCEGYLFLREAISENDYKNLNISPDEIFISDGAGCDIANIQEIFAVENRIAIPDPTYPVYLESNVMAGRTQDILENGTHGGVTYLPCNEENDFLPLPPNHPVDLIYLCSPNNPTGSAMDKDLLTRWVKYARENEAIIIFDGAYTAYIQSPNVPHSIYEIEGARDVAIEIRSFSKSAGFTGLRCSYTVVPHCLKVKDSGETQSLHALWKRRHDTKFNGVAYPVQKAALALYSETGKQEQKQAISIFSNQAKNLLHSLKKLQFKVFGGTDSPYIWLKTPRGQKSWDYFDYLLEKAHIIAVPGRGFGVHGEGYLRLSAFANEDHIQEAVSKLEDLL